MASLENHVLKGSTILFFRSQFNNTLILWGKTSVNTFVQIIFANGQISKGAKGLVTYIWPNETKLVDATFFITKFSFQQALFQVADVKSKTSKNKRETFFCGLTCLQQANRFSNFCLLNCYWKSCMNTSP